ncbi:hypothetical protein QYE76_034017 [Lolium multiflorum]|uniref:Uncharacterized protein n=1 Tax=Lolium multiflorum TaxID=4521 RepID=A0AAD8QYS0_LOLMU|nr:hypothetical protein QYE76_034017 [Lolium multiflorum]
MRWETAATATGAEAEALQERIWDLHDKLSHAILSLSACAGLPGCGCGHVVVKGRRPGGCRDLAAASAMVDARGLHAIRAALEDLEGHLHFLHDVQLQQRAERDAAIARVQQSRILLAARLAEHRGKRHGVIEEALGFVGDVLDKNQFVSPEDVYGMHNQSDEDEDRTGHGSNMVLHQLALGRQTPAVQYRRTDNRFHSGGSRRNSKEKHLEVLLARG